MRVTFAIRSYAMYNIIHKNTQRVGLYRKIDTYAEIDRHSHIKFKWPGNAHAFNGNRNCSADTRNTKEIIRYRTIDIHEAGK